MFGVISAVADRFFPFVGMDSNSEESSISQNAADTVFSGPVLSIRNLVKTYRTGAKAVRDVSLDVQPGEIFGLIGPDGAGKTTTFQILGGVMDATSGAVELFGHPPRMAADKTGYLTQAFSLYQDLSVWENLRYVGELRKLPLSVIEERGMAYLERFDMRRFADRLAGKLSGGMKQKLALACALIGNPRLLLLDEPTTGVDPVSRREFWDVLTDLAAEGLTIVTATPYLDEAERCTRVALMYDGRILDTGTPTALRDRLGLVRLEVRASDLSRAEDVLRGSERIADAQRYGDRLDVMVSDGSAGETAVRETCATVGIEVTDVRLRKATLENAFVTVLRNLQPEQRTVAFPYRRRFGNRSAEYVAVGARGLDKRFGDFQAVKNVSLEIRPGEIYGLLGANGAGKTTTIKMLCGLVEPTGGEIALAGERGAVRSGKVRERVGYMSQKFSLYDDLSVDENLEFFAGVYGVPRRDREEKKRWVLSFAGLEGRGGELTGRLPGGWKQRVAFGAAILHEPEVLFLDEPTSGVDPIARRALWRMINGLADHGVAVLVTTHYLEEAEQCNRLGMMVGGELVAEGTPTAIKAGLPGGLIEVLTDDAKRAAAFLKNRSRKVSVFGDRLHVVSDGGNGSDAAWLTKELTDAGIRVFDAYPEPYSLEDVFITVVERN